MAGKQVFEWEDNFFGHRIYHATAASNVGHNWLITDTSSAGAPTHVPVDGSSSGEVAIDFDSQSEVQNVCLSFANTLQFDIDKIRFAQFRVKMNQATVDSATSFAFGLTGDRNDAIDTIAQAALFRVVGGDSTTNVVLETDDGTNNNDDIASGTTLINAYKVFEINFVLGTADVRFLIDGQPAGAATTFDMSNYTGSLQPFFQIQKTADTNVDGFTIDRFYIEGLR